MPTLSKWVKAQVHLGTLGTAVAISGITKANPGVVSYGTGTDPSENDYVALLDVVGMYQVNNRIWRAVSVNGTGNTFNLDGVGEDSTLYDTFTSGNFKPITWTYNFSTLIDIGATGGEFDMLDATTIHDAVRIELPNMASPIVFNMRSQWDPADVALAAVLAASDAQSLRAMRVSFASGYKMAALGYLGATLIPVGSRGELVETPIKFAAAGPNTNFTS